MISCRTGSRAISVPLQTSRMLTHPASIQHVFIQASVPLVMRHMGVRKALLTVAAFPTNPNYTPKVRGQAVLSHAPRHSSTSHKAGCLANTYITKRHVNVV